MDTPAFPTGKLTLTRPINFAPLPAVGVAKTYSADGNLTQVRPDRAGQFQAGQLPGHGGQQELAFQAGERGPAARVDARAQSDMARGAAPDIETIRIRPGLGITGRRAE